MIHQHLTDLIRLVCRRYPDWDGFDHPEFVADELEYKRDSAEQAREWLSLAAVDEMLAAGQTDEMLARLEQLSRQTNLLWRQVPSASDVAVLHHPELDAGAFCAQVRNLLHGDGESPRRLHAFVAYLARHNLPNKWTFPTYFLFLLHPDSEMFVKPRTAEWFLKFVGQPTAVSGIPDGDTYARLLAATKELLAQLRPYGAQDMIDVQSFLWVAFRESRAATGPLNVRGQVELDVPRTVPLPPARFQQAAGVTAVAESGPGYFTPALTLADIAREGGWAEADLSRWAEAIARKGQAVFYGPPGTGKTYLARQLARHLSGGGDGFWELVQFHPAYAYEDFVQGIRPLTNPDGSVRYEQVNGRFLDFCRRAAHCQDTCVMIIDEINRADLAAVFGELMFLLEYRQEAVALAGGGEPFAIPGNVRLIGTMNTADRSIALVDHALRRRFAFINLAPDWQILRHYHRHTAFDPEPLIALLIRLNEQIGDAHYHLGHTFFLDKKIAQSLAAVWQQEIEPYLEEYFFDQPERLRPFRWHNVAPTLESGA